MKHAVAYAAWMIVILAGASMLRLARLDNRPMHCDEAVHALKFGQLLQQRNYVYDPDEYHGPILNYLTWPIAWLASDTQLTEVTEVQLRLVPAISGILLVALTWLVRDQIGHAAACFAAVLMAVSPAMVYFSRYYIQEMLLVCATFGAVAALWRFASLAERRTPEGKQIVGDPALPARDGNAEERRTQRTKSLRSSFLCAVKTLRQRRFADNSGRADRRVGSVRRWPLFAWPVVFGACVGLMHVSKETCIISLFAMAVAATTCLSSLRRMPTKRLVVAGIVASLVSISLSALLFSSFFQNPRGIYDSYATYGHYLEQAAGEGNAGQHVYPWHYYLRILCWWPSDNASVWSEAPIAILAMIGMGAGAVGRSVSPSHMPYVRFLSIYTIVMTVAYAVIPYKTPWCALGFWHGVILLAGVGAATLVRLSLRYVSRGLILLVLAAAIAYLTSQSYRASFSACASPGNPYVYAHTTHDVSQLARQIESLAEHHPDGRDMHVQVLCPDDDYWPLPWYLRGLPRTAWFRGMPQGPPAPVIVTQQSLVPALTKYLYRDQPPGQRHLYVPLPSPLDNGQWQLRPYVPLEVYVRRDLWERYEANAGRLGTL